MFSGVVGRRVTISCKNIFDENPSEKVLGPSSSRRHIHENMNNYRSFSTNSTFRPSKETKGNSKKNSNFSTKQTSRTSLNPLSPVFQFPKNPKSNFQIPSLSETSDYSSGTDPEHSARNRSPQENFHFHFDFDGSPNDFDENLFRRTSISSSSSSISNLSSISSSSESKNHFSTRLNPKKISDENEFCFCDKENIPNKKKSRRTNPTLNFCSNCQSRRRKSNRQKILPTTNKINSTNRFFDKNSTNSNVEFSVDLTGLNVEFSVEYPNSNSTTNSFCKCSTVNEWNPIVNFSLNPSPSFLYDFYYSDLNSGVWFPVHFQTQPVLILNEFYLSRFYNEHLTNYFLDERLSQNENHNLCFFTATAEPIQTAPKRSWLRLNAPNKTQPTAIFTVMNYNILCDRYATHRTYGYCPSWALKWEYRRKQILDELRSYAADIIALQEIETDQFYFYFLPELKKLGYDGIFSPKSRAKTMCEQDRRFVDGCAIFFRQSKFRLIKDYLVEFNQLAMSAANGSPCHDMINRVTTKDNIGLVALLETKEEIVSKVCPTGSKSKFEKQILFVCTAHIHWDPKYSDVKVVQTLLLLSKLKTIIDDAIGKHRAQTNSLTDCSKVPLVLCGDFNSLPDSGVVELMCNGKISITHADFKDLRYESFLKKIIPNDTNSDSNTDLAHPFKLQSAYETTSSPIMPYTNYTYDFKGIIDYVFYSSQVMRVLGVLGPLDPNWLQTNRIYGCPHPSVPSDHFSLLVEFELNTMEQPNTSTANRNNKRTNKRRRV